MTTRSAAQRNLEDMIRDSQRDKAKEAKKLIKELEDTIKSCDKDKETIIELRKIIFGNGDSDATRGGLLMAIQQLNVIDSRYGIYTVIPKVPYVRKADKPNLAYLVILFNETSLNTIEKLKEIKAKATAKLKELTR